MSIKSTYFRKLLEKYKPSLNGMIHITDVHAKILASTDELRVGTVSDTAQYILSLKRQSIIDNADPQSIFNSGQNPTVVYGTPLFLNGELWGAIIIKEQQDKVHSIGLTIKAAVEAALEYESYSESIQKEENRFSDLACMLLEESADVKRCTSIMNNLEIDPTLDRSVICIELDYIQNKYFNINLNLGYQASIEKLNQQVFNTVKANRYLNSQDLCLLYDDNQIIVIKSFNPIDDTPKIYLALDKICADILQSLAAFHTCTFKMAYGNLYCSIGDVRKSYHEAKEIIAIGSKKKTSSGLFALNDLLFDNICHNLSPQIVNKIMKPAIKNLTKKNGELHHELLECAELFVDNCFNITLTSQNGCIHRNTIKSRLEKLKALTGLDPMNDFKDAFMIKMIASYIK